MATNGGRKPLVAIIATTYIVARDRAVSMGLDHCQWMFVGSAHVLAGLRASDGLRVEFVEGWERREDRVEIERALKLRGLA